LRVAIVAGETSGVLLGAGLIRALRARVETLHVEGIGGPQMIAAGCRTLYPMERLSVMGLVEAAGRYLQLVPVRRRLARAWKANPPDVFIGIDAPDFNLRLEYFLRQAGIPTVHYVSPSVWAWRRYRVHKISRAVDRMLTLFPFEEAFYRAHDVPVSFVGHPLADEIPMESDRIRACDALGISASGKVVALLPGSRMSEVKYLAETLIYAAKWLHQRHQHLDFILPVADELTGTYIRNEIVRCGGEPHITVIEGQSRTAMAAADVVLLASGTATLEALLLQRPMVITYRTHPLTYQIMKAMFHVPWVGLPNLLAGKAVAPELLQAEATPERLGAAVLDILENPQRQEESLEIYRSLHEQLRRDASARAAEAVLEVAGST